MKTSNITENEKYKINVKNCNCFSKPQRNEYYNYGHCDLV